MKIILSCILLVSKRLMCRKKTNLQFVSGHFGVKIASSYESA